MNYEQIYKSNTQENLHGRYITNDHIEPFLNEFNNNNELEIIGKSLLGKPIYSYNIGNGNNRMLIWSQMHGNESTTTKAIIDLITLLNSNSEIAVALLKNFTFYIVPILNPDGAQLYTRENANNIDLNRDFKDFSQPESILLQKTFDEFKPTYCYNMHDQRTIYGIESSRKPATVSFLAPSFNENCDFNENRSTAATVIVAMNEMLQEYIPGQVGIFDDNFNDNCAGDSFQKQEIPTILFESGHFANDYNREITRKYIFFALLKSFDFIQNNYCREDKTSQYLNIPQNNSFFYDFLYKNVNIICKKQIKSITFAAQFIEELIGDKILFIAKIVKIDDLDSSSGHYEFDAKGSFFKKNDFLEPILDDNADFYLGNDIKVVNGFVQY